jgi:predicted DCC family thiol-disulfide oxidoreductase YuxK
LLVADGPWAVRAMLIVASILSGLLALGRFDRWAALGLAYVWACLLGRNPLISNPGIPYIGWLLIAHALVAPSPWRPRRDAPPLAPWTLPPGVYAAAWIVMAVGYSFSGLTKLVSPSWIDGSALGRVLENPLARPGWQREAMLALPDFMLRAATWGGLALELLYAPLALVRRARPWIWLAMVLMHLSLIALVDFADLTVGMLMIHGLTFDPAWIAPAGAPGVRRVFYDGHCGLCHRSVSFLLGEDPRGEAFRFAPLRSEAFERAMAAAGVRERTDSMAIQTDEGALLLRSEGVLYALGRLGGVWRAPAAIARCAPRRWRDAVYDAIARNRLRVFGTREEACPVMPAELRNRFEI